MPAPPLPLIEKCQVNDSGSAVIFTFRDLQEEIIQSIQTEIDGLQNARIPANYAFDKANTPVTLTVSSDDLSTLAMNVTKVMTRKILLIDEEHPRGQKMQYASLSDTIDVLTTLKNHASKQHQPQLVIGIDSLINSARQIERM